VAVTPDDPAPRLGVRPAGPADAEDVGRLLDTFNREFGDPTPGPERLAARVAARRLYERLGFTNREGRADGPLMYVYEREL
jgi:hypothetical protein